MYLELFNFNHLKMDNFVLTSYISGKNNFKLFQALIFSVQLLLISESFALHVSLNKLDTHRSRSKERGQNLKVAVTRHPPPLSPLFRPRFY